MKIRLVKGISSRKGDSSIRSKEERGRILRLSFFYNYYHFNASSFSPYLSLFHWKKKKPVTKLIPSAEASHYFHELMPSPGNIFRLNYFTQKRADSFLRAPYFELFIALSEIASAPLSITRLSVFPRPLDFFSSRIGRVIVPWPSLAPRFAQTIQTWGGICVGNVSSFVQIPWSFIKIGESATNT